MMSTVNDKILHVTVITVVTVMRKCTIVLTYTGYGVTIYYVCSMYEHAVYV